MNARAALLALVVGTSLSFATSAFAQTAMTYQGQLQDGGAVVTGTVDIQFAVYAAASGGAAIGTTATVTGVAVTNGLFTAEFDCGAAGFTDPSVDRWLEVRVKLAGQPSYTTLGQRQKLNRTAFANGTRGVYVAANGNVGIANAKSPVSQLDIKTGDTNSLITLQAGATAKYYAGFNLVDQNTTIWGFGKDPFNNFFIDRSGVGTAFLLDPISQSGSLGAGLISNPSNYARVFSITGRTTATTNSGTAALVLNNPVQDARWSIGVGSSGNLFFDSSGTNTDIVSVPVLQIRGGSDIAEPYDVAPAGDILAKPGMVVSIDPNGKGTLAVSTKAYDLAVAGIISGANGVKPGLTLTQTGTIADGELPVANVGRVWCYVDADEAGAIQPGDLLTTSSTPGHAMKADAVRANGAVLGKAMTSLEHGKGMVLVLVGLQ
jgi:hypothetical protein